MKFDAGTRTRILAHTTLTFDPSGSTVELRIDGTWYPATWQGSPVQGVDSDGDPTWAQTARTTVYFAGPEADLGAAELLAVGRHLTQTRVTSGTDIIVADSSPVDVG